MTDITPAVSTAKLLVVDDDPEVRSLLTEGLSAAGYTVVGVGSGERALEIVEEFDPDLALVDLRLPGIDGVEVVRSLKARTADGAFFPAILITGDEDADARVRGFRAGCDDYLAKPVRLYELNARVENLLARRAQSVQLAAANAQLKQNLERKRVLASLVVHDLRNPLSALQGNVELLWEDIGEQEFAKEIIDDCRVLCTKALSMVAGLLDVEELEEGLLIADPTEVKVADVCLAAARHHGATVDARGLRLKFDVPEGLTARLDADLVGRLVENLLDNAVRYAPRKGLVVVSARTEGDDIVIRVGNDGPAVPIEEREKIFGRYYRIEARRSGARANRGLGLYFCKLVAEAHGGTIEIEELDQLPASFVVRLPNVPEN